MAYKELKLKYKVNRASNRPPAASHHQDGSLSLSSNAIDGQNPHLAHQKKSGEIVTGNSNFNQN